MVATLGGEHAELLRQVVARRSISPGLEVASRTYGTRCGPPIRAARSPASAAAANALQDEASAIPGSPGAAVAGARDPVRACWFQMLRDYAWRISSAWTWSSAAFL